MKKCKSCQSEIDDKAKKCPKCQADQRNWFAKHKILTGILVVILISIFANMGGKGGSNNGTTSNSNSTNTTKENKTETVAKINDTVTANDLAFTVTGITSSKTLGSSYTKKTAQGTFNVVTLSIKNVGKETATIDSSMIKIIDGQGRKFDRSIDGQTAKGLDQGHVDLFLQQVQPSLSVVGDIVFDLPDDATDLKLLVKGSMFGTEKQISLTK